MNLNLSAAAPRHLATGVLLLGVAAVLLAALPVDALAEAGQKTGALKAAENFEGKAGESAKSVGIVIFSVVAIFAIARATLGGKAGQGLIAFCVACLGMSVTLAPQAVMSGLGGWVTGLFA